MLRQFWTRILLYGMVGIWWSERKGAPTLIGSGKGKHVWVVIHFQSLRKRRILDLKMSPKVWYPAVSNLEANCWLESRISLRRVWYGFGTSFFVREYSMTFTVAPTQSFSLWGLKYLIAFLKATFENSSSITEFSFSLKAFSGRIARSQHSMPSTLFPAKTE